MAEQGAINFDVTVDTADFDKGIKRITQQIEQSAASAEKQSAKIGESFSQAAQGALQAAESYEQMSAEQQALSITSLLEKYRGYAEQRVNLEKQFNDEYNRLNALRNGTDDELIDGKLNELLFQKVNTIKELDTYFAKREFGFNAWLESLASVSLDKLKEQLKAAEAELEKLEKSGNGDTGTLSVARAKVTAMKKQLPAAKPEKTLSPGEKAVKDWGELYKALTPISKELDTIGKTVGGTAGQILQSAAQISTSTLSMINGIVQLSNWSAIAMTKTAAGASASMVAVEKASVILAIVSAAIQVVTALFSLFKKDDYMEKFNKEMAKLNYQLQLVKLNAKIGSDQKDTIFGNDLWEQAKDNVDAAKDALKEYDATITDIGNRKKYTGFEAVIAEMIGLKNTFDSAEESIANMSVKIRHGTWFRSAKYTTLKDAVPELFKEDGEVDMNVLGTFIKDDTFGKLSEENQQYLQQMADYWKSYQDAMDKVKDYLEGIFGKLGTTMSDALADAFVNGTDAAKAFTDTVSKMLEDLAKQMVYSVTIAPLMDTAQKEMLSVMTDVSLSDEEKFRRQAAILGALTKDAIAQQAKANELYKVAQESAAGAGIEIFKPEKKEEPKEGVSGQLKSEMTEGTASQLVGLWNMTALDTRALKDTAAQIHDLAVPGFANIAEMAKSNLLIEVNTRNTASNTAATVARLDEGFGMMCQRLDAIATNTQTNNSRRV